jgi:hypothetical protein
MAGADGAEVGADVEGADVEGADVEGADGAVTAGAGLELGGVASGAAGACAKAEEAARANEAAVTREVNSFMAISLSNERRLCIYQHVNRVSKKRVETLKRLRLSFTAQSDTACETALS